MSLETMSRFSPKIRLLQQMTPQATPRNPPSQQRPLALQGRTVIFMLELSMFYESTTPMLDELSLMGNLDTALVPKERMGRRLPTAHASPVITTSLSGSGFCL